MRSPRCRNGHLRSEAGIIFADRCPQCRVCKYAADLRYREKNKAESRARHAAWRATPAGQESERRSLERRRAAGASLAHQKVRKAIDGGRLTREPCQRCGSTRKVQAHHHNGYGPAHWFDVIWLCPLDHNLEHARLKAEAATVRSTTPPEPEDGGT